ncbi:SDR family NAD(P)-dependent oxidoreductase [Streptomyces sp. NP160]|uniref:SDR family NAD(P)-dependent oxidoreductase n=1 Tax=Streptomyces sp. NP160 TaxID=2586637 RepID=UPI001118504B|nr:SDR family NAD(P)-dependent oxidoreductase [Streptomyces sp. NP160]
MIVREVAAAGHTVFAGMRATTGRNAAAVAELEAHAHEHDLRLHALELDVSDQDSVDSAVERVLREAGRVDVVVHNAGHMVLGPTEAFTPEQLHEVFDVNAVSTQRLNRAVLPHLRAQRDGLVVWIGSTSTRGGTPPYLAPYFAAKAAEDSLAVSYAAELARFGVDTVIVVPGSFTTGTNHFANAGSAHDDDVAAAYEAEYAGLVDQVGARLGEISPPDADPSEVARQVAAVVGAAKGTCPLRVHVDPADDGAERVNALGDQVRADFYHRIGLGDLLQVRVGDAPRRAEGGELP